MFAHMRNTETSRRDIAAYRGITRAICRIRIDRPRDRHFPTRLAPPFLTARTNELSPFEAHSRGMHISFRFHRSSQIRPRATGRKSDNGLQRRIERDDPISRIISPGWPSSCIRKYISFSSGSFTSDKTSRTIRYRLKIVESLKDAREASEKSEYLLKIFITSFRCLRHLRCEFSDLL